MTQVAPDPFTIELGVVGGPEETAGEALGDQRSRNRLRRGLVAAVVLVACLLAMGGSVTARPGLGEPLWSGEMSLTGFTLGSDSLYMAAPGGRVMTSRDVATGAERWSLALDELPDQTIDLGSGVAAVQTRQVAPDTGTGFAVRPDTTITFVRTNTGERIARTAGYLYAPSAAGLPVAVFTNRARSADGCTAPETPCLDVTAWNVITGTVAWRLSLPPGAAALPANSQGQVNGQLDWLLDGLLERDPDGTLRMYEMATGAVVGMTTLPAEDRETAQVSVVHDTVMTARRESKQIVVTAYERPSLRRLWSVRVPSTGVDDSPEAGYFHVDECGRAACLAVGGQTSRFVDLANGSFTPPVAAQIFLQLGDDTFLAMSAEGIPVTERGVLVIDAANRIVARFRGAQPVWWTNSGGGGLLMARGAERTGFIVLDDHGRPRDIGSVTGAGLDCSAWGDMLACADPAGTLRAWRVPT